MQLILQVLESLPPEVIVLVVAALPIVELRGAIPVGLMLGMGPWEAILWAVLGNAAIIPPALFFLYAARRWARNWPLVRPLLDWVEARVERRRATVDRYGPWGLALFVGVPLPVTGAWTGSAIATILKLPLGASTAAIIVGILIAAALVGSLSALGWHVLS